MTPSVKLVVRGECLPSVKPPYRLRCRCGFVIVSRTIAPAILALHDHRLHGCVVVAVLQ